MTETPDRLPLLPPRWIRRCKFVFGVFASLVAVLGGLASFAVAVGDLWHAFAVLVGPRSSYPAPAGGLYETPITYVVKSVDALLLALVQFLLASFLWRILDPDAALISDGTTERVDQVKQMLSKVILVILAVRFLELVLGHQTLEWNLLVLVAGILAMALASSLLAKAKG